MTDHLAAELATHLQEPFPPSIEKGLDYGEVDPVMIDADIYGWGIPQGPSPLSGLFRPEWLIVAGHSERN